jgi:solute carrier family 25 phosphate transporter 23/24/25/41
MGHDGPEKESKPVVNFLAGGIGNSFAKALMSPLSRIVVVMQLDENAKHIFPTIRNIYVKEGMQGFFRGTLTMIVHRVPYSGIQLLTYDRIKHGVRDTFGFEESTFVMKSIAGGMSGSIATVACFPLDVVRTRLMSPNSQYKGIAPTLNRIVQEEGFSALYKGITPTLLQRIPDLCLHFSVYETTKFWLMRHYEKLIGWQGCTLGASSVAGFASVTATLPLDMIRRRMMMDGAGGAARQYKNMFGCGMYVVRTQGFLGLYRGYTVELSRVVPQVCVSWYCVEFLRTHLGQRF